MRTTTRQRTRSIHAAGTALTFATLLLSGARTNVVEAQQDAQPSGTSSVWLFQSYFADARITGRPYVAGEPSFSSFDGADIMQLNARGGYTFTPRVEVEGQLGYRQVNPDGGESGSGLTDLLVTGRYLLIETENYNLAGGGYLDLPTGDRDVGGDTFDFGFYGALRSPVSDRVTLTGTLGVDFVKGAGLLLLGTCFAPPPSAGPFPLPSFCPPTITSEGDREASINLGGGAIVQAGDALYIVSELRLEPEFDYVAISGGPDYYAPAIGHLRGALMIGVDDGAPDFSLVGQIVRALP